MSFKKELTKVFMGALSEGVENSKEMLSTNIVPSFEQMSMSSNAPGEFSQEEITDAGNLVNTGKMSNDNDFNTDECCNAKKDFLTSVSEIMTDLIDISEQPDTEETEDLLPPRLMKRMYESTLKKNVKRS